MTKLISNGKGYPTVKGVRPIIDRRFALGDCVAALNYVNGRSVTGKVIMQP